jgi:O-acetylhomoserine (thiol)-lyase
MARWLRALGGVLGETMKNEMIAVHYGYERDPTTKAVAAPIHQTVAFAFDSADHGAALCNLEVEGYRHGRTSNPTTDLLERRVAALEGGVEALCVATGQAAPNYVVLDVTELGCDIVSVLQLYGTTHTQFGHLLPQGVSVRFAKGDQPPEIDKLVDDDTTAVFCETVGNPVRNLCDVQGLARVAHARGIPIISTAHSRRRSSSSQSTMAARWSRISSPSSRGQGVTVGGPIVDSGTSPGRKTQSASRCSASPTLLSRALSRRSVRAGGLCCALPQRPPTHHRTVLSPMSAFLLLQGIETVALRVERHVKNAARVAQFLRTDARVAWINYVGFPGNPCRVVAPKYLGGRACLLMPSLTMADFSGAPNNGAIANAAQN